MSSLMDVAATAGINDLLTAARLIEENAIVGCADDHIKCDRTGSGQRKRGLNSSRRSASSQTRAAHNELEKTRRANLRSCLDRLKDMVPSGSDSPRNTTLSLLTRARHYVLSLEEKEKGRIAEKQRLQDQQRLMRRHLELLTARGHHETPRKRSTSESSTSTISVAADDRDEQPTVDDDSRGDMDGCESTTSAGTRSPAWLEYSPSAKPSITDCSPPSFVDPYTEGLLPALPLFHPRLSIYPYLNSSMDLGCPLPAVSVAALQRQMLAQIPIATASPMPIVTSGIFLPPL